ncbi:hypothetical protein POVCU1_032650 [Plasmodium ovale curtisi]|uniref:Uncharacterized protein n=1 Tax=Plasmodium ovale curtisi TaxID=864141 RepID=A0A1A8WYK3_PLAOA|nr:hypothetical protein POVCU1_032650 [Plasmodium ovale curtisi]
MKVRAWDMNNKEINELTELRICGVANLRKLRTCEVTNLRSYELAELQCSTNNFLCEKEGDPMKKCASSTYVQQCIDK